MLFNTLEMAPPDPILGLAEAFKKDTNPGKINLGIGVYKDAKGNTPVFQSVKRAEMRILTEESTKNYVNPNSGTAEYCAAVQSLLFGADNPIIKQKRAASAHTPGGTGGLRLAADVIAVMAPKATVWLSDPTWPNHPSIFQAAGLAVKNYPYYDAKNKSLDFDAMLAALKTVPEGDFVLLHGCCHNPTGLDPDAAQWKAITDVAKAQKWIPLIDFAYQGLADGIDEDCLGVRAMCAALPEALICSSFSKNFGLYNERVGAMTLVADTAEAAEKALSHVKRCIRTNYSNPPAHGSSIVTTILNDPDLRAEWEGEVKAMRERIHGMRVLFVDTLKAKGVKEDFSFLIRQKGMFSFSGLTKAHVDKLKEKYGIYIVGSGRINVAGMTPDNMDQLCTAIADVLANA
ncbi:MAG: aspartate/tyrosine/aromatic aminotransferase [Candidatus Hydrogenedentes bacterium]|nr:aspartate/tyrosine/aromatic aminotransferase [Candidatus Hydrogenedentota bacterium]